MIKHLLALSPLILTVSPAAAQAREAHYAAGQVWQYSAREQDSDSLVKIQKVEIEDGRPVYHISVTGVRFAGVPEANLLPHLPVSEDALDASVTRRVVTGRDFAGIAIDEDIAEWRAAEGGVLSVPLAQALDDVEGMLSRQL
ncbi:hypothetical protein [Novosphingobium endophyticum]|nr:hypothetical protein [Novosphingobium endophyticum]